MKKIIALLLIVGLFGCFTFAEEEAPKVGPRPAVREHRGPTRGGPGGFDF